jgi:hypothetical protein
MRIKVISCEVIYREVCHAASRSPHQVDVQFLPKGLHDQGCGAMRLRLQSEIDKVAVTKHEAVVLGYALCGNGTVGLAARRVPLIVPRAHDCITLLMGSREKFQKYFEDHPGVYYRSTGWLERGQDTAQLNHGDVQRRTGAGYALAELVGRYGEENGRYLHQQLNAYQSSYTQLTYISTGLEPNGNFESAAEAEAKAKGWSYEKVDGSLRWFDALVSGEWANEDFLTVPPGYRVKVRYDDQLLDIEQV